VRVGGVDDLEDDPALPREPEAPGAERGVTAGALVFLVIIINNKAECTRRARGCQLRPGALARFVRFR